MINENKAWASSSRSLQINKAEAVFLADQLLELDNLNQDKAPDYTRKVAEGIPLSGKSRLDIRSETTAETYQTTLGIRNIGAGLQYGYSKPNSHWAVTPYVQSDSSEFHHTDTSDVINTLDKAANESQLFPEAIYDRIATPEEISTYLLTRLGRLALKREETRSFFSTHLSDAQDLPLERNSEISTTITKDNRLYMLGAKAILYLTGGRPVEKSIMFQVARQNDGTLTSIDIQSKLASQDFTEPELRILNNRKRVNDLTDSDATHSLEEFDNLLSTLDAIVREHDLETIDATRP